VLTRAHAAAASSATAPDVPPVTLSSAPALQAVTALETPALASSSSELPAVSKSNKALIVVLGLLVMALAVAVVVLGFSPPPLPDKPRPSLAMDLRDLPTPPHPAVPLPAVMDAGVVAEVPDAGAEEPEEMVALSPLLHPQGPPPAVPRPRSCHYDLVLQNAARQEMTDLLKGATRQQKDAIEDMGEGLGKAFSNKDCRATEAVLKKMRGVVRASPK
jgi:hypothetical protein